MRTRILRIVALSVIALAVPPRALAELPPVGTVVNKDDAEKYGEVLNPTQQYMLKHGATMPVTEYRKYEWQPVYQEATEKYSSQVRLSPDGRDIVNYVAGAPFPVINENDPQAGTKWMWNHEQGPKYTDNVGIGWNMELVNDRGERERFFGSNFWRRMMWRGRIVLDPKPVVPHEPAIGYSEQWGPLHDPNDLKGAGVLNFRYVSPDVPDDSYLYVPELRKVRRLSMANRSDAFWGTDIDVDSIWTWNSKLSFWTFKYLGTHKQLTRVPLGRLRAARGALRPARRRVRDQVLFLLPEPRAARHRVVEGTPTGFTQYAFSKRIVYIDKESLMALFNEGYDQGGQLWKTAYIYGDAGKSPHDIERQPDGSIKVVPTKTVNPPSYAHERVGAYHGGVVDMQLNHASKWDAPDAYLYPNPGVGHGYVDEPRDWNTPDTFTINYLIKSAGF